MLFLLGFSTERIWFPKFEVYEKGNSNCLKAYLSFIFDIKLEL